jgi:formylglycine-generating enzyme required for sulfatase activity
MRRPPYICLSLWSGAGKGNQYCTIRGNKVDNLTYNFIVQQKAEEMSSKFALVIANTEYQDASFAKLTAPGKDAEEFGQVLRDAKLAAFDNVEVLLNEGESRIRRAIARFFAGRNRDDLLLLYFSGHGIRNEQGQLFLAAHDTEINILEASGVPADFINYAMNNSRSQRQLLILDCCNSGAFAYGTKAANAVGKSMGIATAFEGSGFGRVVLTATDATQYAWEGDKVIGDTQKSVFTHFLIEGLKGEADRDGDGRIGVDELYDYAYEQVVRSTPKQTPGKWTYKQQGDIVLRENLPPREVKPAPLSSELLDLLSHPNPNVRKVGVQELIRLINGENLGLALAAQDKLREIEQEDDSLTMRKMARAELEARGRALERVITNQPSKATPRDDRSVQIPEIEQKQEEEIKLPISEVPLTGALPTSAVTTPAPPLAFPKPNWKLLGGIAGGVLVVTLCIWGSANLLSIPNVTTTSTPTPTSPHTSSPPSTLLSASPTPTFGIGSTLSGKDGMTFVYVPAGEFMMGSDTDEPDEKPVHKITLAAFWIDQTEVTIQMYRLCVESGVCKEPTSKKSYTHSSYYGNAEFDNYPVLYVDWNMAKAYCEWVDRRLPTEAEWEKAARGESAFVYPWGNAFDGTKVNFCDENCSFDWADKSSDDHFADTAPVGSYPNGASPYGALDMAGNAWEWVADWYSDTYYAGSPSSNPLGPEEGQYRVLRGGAWGHFADGVRSARRSWVDPTNADGNVGFRCAMSATP